MKRFLALVCLFGLLVGCLPVELDVTDDGHVIIPRGEGYFTYDPVTGEAVEVYAPSGQATFALNATGGGLITITATNSGMMGSPFEVEYHADGETKTFYSGTNITYAKMSPDGQGFSLTRVSDTQNEEMEEQLAELHMYGVDGQGRLVLTDVAVHHCWMPDSNDVLAVQLTSKDDETDLYTGALVTVNGRGRNGRALHRGRR